MRQHSFSTLSWMAAILAFATRTATAVDYTWAGGVGDPLSPFLSAGNWTPSGGPPNDNNDRAIFNMAGGHTVEFGSTSTPEITNRSFEVRRGRWLFDLLHDGVGGSSFPTVYNLESGGPLTNSASIGTQAGQTAELRIYGNALFGNGAVNAQGALNLGTVAGSTGDLSLIQASWNSDSLVTIGREGTGTLELDATSSISGVTATLGFSSGSHGTLRLLDDSPFADGPATATLSGSIFVGREGTGVLSLANGTLSNGGTASMAQLAGSSAVATVTDGGVWDAGASMYVGGGSGGAGGGALLTVTGDGSISTPGGRVTVADDVTIYPTGAITITGDGTLEVGGVLATHPGSNLHLLQGGTLRLDAIDFQPADDTFNWDSGKLHMTSNFDADAHPISVSPLGSTVGVNQFQALEVDGTLRVGTFDQGILDIGNGGVVTSGVAASGGAQVGSVITTTGGAHVFLYNNADWINRGDLRVGGLPANGETAVLVFNGGDLVTDNTLVAAPNSTPLAAGLLVAGPGSSWQSQNAAYLGGNQTNSGGSGTLEISNGAVFAVGTAAAHSIGELIVWSRFDVTMDNGTITAKTLRVHGSITPAGPFSGDVTASNLLDVDGGTVELTPGNSISVGDTVTIRRGGAVTSAIIGNGNTQVSLTGAGSTWTTPTALVIGSSTTGIGKIRSLSVGAGSTVSLGPNAASVTAPDSLTLTGGTINAASVDMGSHTLTAHGVINANFTTTGDIVASGDLTLGNAASTAGFNTAGGLFALASTVTLNDANAARLGPQTTMGFFGSPGTLIAPNGLFLDSGHSLVGSGDVDTLNDPTRPLTNNGSIAGASATARLGLGGFVNGTGTFDNVVFTGSFSPGDSAAAIQLGSAELGEENTTILEIGGTTPGNQHDQLVFSGLAALDGTLDIDLIGGFTPALGDSFTIIRAIGGVTGTFSDAVLPPLPTGQVWDIRYEPTSVELVTTTGLAGDINGDGGVNRQDVALFTTLLGTGATSLLDLHTLQSQLGQGMPAASSAAVPEPATWLLAVFGVTFFARLTATRRGALPRPVHATAARAPLWVAVKQKRTHAITILLNPAIDGGHSDFCAFPAPAWHVRGVCGETKFGFFVDSSIVFRRLAADPLVCSGCVRGNDLSFFS